MKTILDHFARNKAKYGGLLVTVGGYVYTLGPEYHRIAEGLILAGGILGGSILPSDKVAKVRQEDALAFEDKVRKL